MIDIRILREYPERVKDNLAKRNMVDFPFDEILSLEKKRREILTGNQKLKGERNKISLEISRKKQVGEDASSLITEMKEVSDQIASNDKSSQKVESEFFQLAARLPNFIDPEVPVGPDESANRELGRWGEATSRKENPDHINIAAMFDLVDIERAAKTSGARFYFLRRDLVRLNHALISFSLDFLRKKGFVLIQPPYMLKRDAIAGAVILSDFEEVIYKIADEDLYLIGTSEHAIAAMHMDEIFSQGELPIRYSGVSPCFRKEAGAHGRDTKGIFRVHQFEKVEQFIFCEPENSEEEHRALLNNSQEFMQRLGIPHRVVILSSADMGKVPSKTYDIEAWIPSQGKYRELVSCSNCTDFQSRSLSIKYRKKAHEESLFLHTLNSTLVATERTLVVLLEQYFDSKEKIIRIPEELISYMDGQNEILPAK
ncbi:MAG TPA: serine--tRNA ligase [Nitrososphaerales archaeon]|nr:serine--tRNA ligase [Nitrososphaerales archaeon]